MTIYDSLISGCTYTRNLSRRFKAVPPKGAHRALNSRKCVCTIRTTSSRVSFSKHELSFRTIQSQNTQLVPYTRKQALCGRSTVNSTVRAPMDGSRSGRRCGFRCGRRADTDTAAGADADAAANMRMPLRTPMPRLMPRTGSVEGRWATLLETFPTSKQGYWNVFAINSRVGIGNVCDKSM